MDVISTTENDGATEKAAAAKKPPTKKAAATQETATFPRVMKVVNETAMPYVFARTHLNPGESKPVKVKDEHHLARIQTDIEHLLALNDHYKGDEIKPLRIEEAD